MPIADLELSRICRSVLDDESNRFTLELYRRGKAGLLKLIDQVKKDISKTDLSDDLDARIECLLRKTLMVEAAVVRLRERGLYVRQLDSCGLIGGSHVDDSSGFREVENTFMLQVVCDHLELNLLGMIVPVASFEEAVEKILAKVQPQDNVPGPTLGRGPQYY